MIVKQIFTKSKMNSIEHEIAAAISETAADYHQYDQSDHHHQYGQSDQQQFDQSDHRHQHDKSDHYQYDQNDHHHQYGQSDQQQFDQSDHRHQHDKSDPYRCDQSDQQQQKEAAGTSNASSSPTSAAADGAKGVSLWQICPFLRQVSCPSSPEGSSVRCLKCGDGEQQLQQFNDLGSTYNHLKKHHPQQFQRLYKLWKSAPTPTAQKRRAQAQRRQQQQQNANRTQAAEGQQGAAPVSVNIELKEKALVDPSNLFSDGHQFGSENDPTPGGLVCSSTVWCVGLFQRHHFRNGTIGALCLECGQVMWELDTDTQLMDHIVNKHPEYMPISTVETNLMGAARAEEPIVAPTFVDEQGELWQCLDVATDGESAEEIFHRHGARPIPPAQQQQQMAMADDVQNVQQQQKLLLGCAFDGLSLLCCFRAIWVGQQRALFQSLGHNHPLGVATIPMGEGSAGPNSSAAESVMESIERVLQQDHSTHVDAIGKEWHWLADVYASGDEAELRRVCRANDLYREGGARNFSCKWSSRNARSTHNCPLRGLYVPERRALFHRHNHNHPMPMTGGKSEHGGTHHQTMLPPNNNGYVDRKGKEWQLLADISAKSELVLVCRANGLVQNGPRNVVGKAYFGCQRAKKGGRTTSGTGNGAGGGTQCPYRALYVAKRKALFHRLAHNHALRKRNIEETKTNTVG